MFGKNKIAPLVKSDGKIIEVVKIFKTIQGEGIFAGRPAIFIRLSGCNLKCSFCDTEFDIYNSMDISEILETCRKLSIQNQNNPINFIVITGGEPLRQPIENLCKLLIDNNFQIQIETNGTIKRKLPNVHIVCSPKLTNNKYHIDQELVDFADSFKFLVKASGDNYTNVPNIKTNKPIFVQAIDEYDEKKNIENITYATKIAIKNNISLSVQLHKIINVE